MTNVVSPPEVTVIGGASPLGHHLLTRLAADTTGPLRVLTRTRRVRSDHEAYSRVIEIRGDLRRPETVAPALVRGGLVINLALSVPYDAPHETRPGQAGALGNEGLAMINLARACAEAGVARLVHCSSVSIIGRARAPIVDEDTPCEPETPYERAKLADEQTLEREARGRFSLAIARPVGILGHGLASLVALLTALRDAPRGVSYARSCLFGRRRMHLACAENVAAALVWLARRDQRADVERFIVSEDDVPENNYRDVERLLLAALGRPDYPVPPLPLPAAALRACLALAHRRTADVTRTYDGSRLMATGFTRVITLPEAVTRFANDIRAQASAAPERVEARSPTA